MARGSCLKLCKTALNVQTGASSERWHPKATTKTLTRTLSQWLDPSTNALRMVQSWKPAQTRSHGFHQKLIHVASRVRDDMLRAARSILSCSIKLAKCDHIQKVNNHLLKRCTAHPDHRWLQEPITCLWHQCFSTRCTQYLLCLAWGSEHWDSKRPHSTPLPNDLFFLSPASVGATQSRPMQGCRTWQRTRSSAESLCRPAGRHHNKHLQHLLEPSHHPSMLQGDNYKTSAKEGCSITA